jgi:hypothetical protein
MTAMYSAISKAIGSVKSRIQGVFIDWTNSSLVCKGLAASRRLRCFLPVILVSLLARCLRSTGSLGRQSYPLCKEEDILGLREEESPGNGEDEGKERK